MAEGNTVRVLVEPRVTNWIDDTDPEYDFRAGYVVKYKDALGDWHELYYGTAAAAWLAERGYEQVSCTFRRHRLAGRYEHLIDWLKGET